MTNRSGSILRTGGMIGSLCQSGSGACSKPGTRVELADFDLLRRRLLLNI
ncbi:hypothetical protein ACQPXH_26550 [Nocardia sp. CA-135953]